MYNISMLKMIVCVCILLIIFQDLAISSSLGSTSEFDALLVRLESTEARQVKSEQTIVNLKNELTIAKRQIQNLQTKCDSRCQSEKDILRNISEYRRSFMPVATVGFTACVSVQDLKGLGIHHTIVFDNVITNTLGAYHATTGIFTAPYKGMYVFSSTAMSNPGNEQYLEIVKDGVAVNGFYADSRGTEGFQSSSVQWVLELDQGSEVWIRTSTHGEIHGNCFTLFSGFLLSEYQQ